MILYHVFSPYQLLNVIVYKEFFHKGQVCYILLSDNIKKEYPQFMQMEDLFFDKIFVYHNELFCETENRNSTNKTFGKFLTENNINLHEFSEIIVESRYSYFESYLVENKCKFSCLEKASKLISTPEIAEEKLDSSFIDKVLVFFGINQKIQINKNSAILITQDPSNLKNMSFEEYKKVYQLIVDYFVPAETRLVIKTTPDDLMFYNHLFPQTTVVKKNFPSELLPLVFTEKPHTVIALPSASINNLIGYFENYIRISTSFEGDFNITHKYYCAVRLISELFEDYEIHEINSDKLLLENLLNISENQLGRCINTVKNLSQVPDKSILIIDDFNRGTLPTSKEICNFVESVDKESIIFFINSNKEYLFYDYPNKEIFESIVPVNILHSSIIDETEQYPQTLFIYSKRKDTRNMINLQKIEKTLNNSNEILKKDAMSEEQLKIKILEGILEATEKRLEHYIKLEKELREQLD